MLKTAEKTTRFYKLRVLVAIKLWRAVLVYEYYAGSQHRDAGNGHPYGCRCASAMLQMFLIEAEGSVCLGRWRVGK